MICVHSGERKRVSNEGSGKQKEKNQGTGWSVRWVGVQRGSSHMKTVKDKERKASHTILASGQGATVRKGQPQNKECEKKDLSLGGGVGIHFVQEKM